MSIDDRLRSGLSGNTDLLEPDVERALAVTYGRARGRRRARVGVVSLVAVAAIAGTAAMLGLPDRDGDAVPATPTPSDLMGVHGLLEPGTYSMGVWGGNSPADRRRRVTLEVPAGYFSHGGYVVDAGSDGSPEADQYGEVSVWEVDRVPTDPCDASTATDPGPGVEDLARALVRQPGPSTRPEPIELDGRAGLYLEVGMPPRLDVGDCSQAQHTLWLDASGDGGQSLGQSGVHYLLWILDVDGTRLVVLAALYRDQPDGQHDEQVAIAQSVRFGG